VGAAGMKAAAGWWIDGAGYITSQNNF